MSPRLNHIQNWPELAKLAKWKAKALAKQCGVSLRTLERYFLEKMGRHPKDWLTEQRQREALALLQDGSTVKEAASCLHYKHQNHLSNDFKKHWGVRPTKKLNATSVKTP